MILCTVHSLKRCSDKMPLIVFFLLMIRAGCCTEEFKFEVKNVTVGQNVTLSCPHQTSALYRETLYWIRLVSGNWPEFLGATFNFMDDDVSKISHIQTKQEQGKFLLYINEAKRNDNGLYYCIKIRQLDFIFINGNVLKVQGLESDITEIIQMPPSSPVYPETRKTLQCSVLSDSEGKPCPADNRVYWFKAGSDHSHPSLLYLQKNSGEECESASPEAQTAQRCFYNFSESSDAGTYHCAVAACGQILFGNGAELHYEHYEATTTCPSLVNIVFGFGLAISLIVLAVLIYAIKESNGNVSAAQQAKQVLCTKWPANIYSAVVFTVVTDDSGKKKANTETKKIYAAVI
uniref:Ig-like domain-containing protein n=1 Tax=Poecilia reticulata TaxID=8081 RepID=A0A3P9PI07_POERE